MSKLFFAYGFGNAFVFPLFSGSSAVLVDRRPSPAAVDELVARHRVTLLYSVPSAYAALVADRADGTPPASPPYAPRCRPARACPPELGERVTELLGAPVLEQIGSTEAGHAFCANSLDANTPGTVGRPVPGFDVELRDRAGHPVPDGSEGELWVRGPTLTARLPEPARGDGRKSSSTAGSPPGTARRREPDGTYRHLGRADDMEMVGGITVSPLEVEAVLRKHPAVREVAVAAVTDERGATALRAYVVIGVAATAAPTFAATRSGLEAELIGLARAAPRRLQGAPGPSTSCRRCPAPRPASSAATSSARRVVTVAVTANTPERKGPMPQPQSLLSDRGFYLGPMFQQAAARHGAVPVTLDRPLDVDPDLGLDLTYPVAGRPGRGPVRAAVGGRGPALRAGRRPQDGQRRHRPAGLCGLPDRRRARPALTGPCRAPSSASC